MTQTIPKAQKKQCAGKYEHLHDKYLLVYYTQTELNTPNTTAAILLIAHNT
jgi:hypothetical protein